MKSRSHKLPILSWREILKALSKKNYRVVHQTGSHIIMSKDGKYISIPRKDEIKRGLLLAIIHDCGMTKEEFLELL